MNSIVDVNHINDVNLITFPLETTIYVRGLEKNCSINIIFNYFIKAGSINCLKLSRKKEIKSIIFNDMNLTNDMIINQGYCWIIYENSISVDIAIKTLHHTKLNSTYLFIRKEDGYKPIIKDKSSSSTTILSSSTNVFTTSIPRDIKKRNNNNIDNANNKLNNKKIKNIVTYTGKGVVVDNLEYPTPTGSYITILLNLCYSEFNLNNNHYKPLLKVITRSKERNKHAKEISESMAMVNGLKKLGDLQGIDWNGDEYSNVHVYVVGDGIEPFTAVCLALFFPLSWNFWSIDPLLDFDRTLLEHHAARFHIVSQYSQDFVIPDFTNVNNNVSSSSSSSINININNNVNNNISIVVACHSHAPLQELWDRVPVPKYAVTLPCCGKTWTSLNIDPITDYEDYEVFSPKRHVYLYQKNNL